MTTTKTTETAVNKLVAEIKKEHAEIVGTTKKALDHARKAGELLASLKEKVVINCPGYAARALWKDESVVPVRGQIAWLIPQPEVDYGVVYDGVNVVPRRDGIVLQMLEGGDMRGYYLAAKVASTAWPSPLRSSLVWRVASPRWPWLISRLTSIGFYRIRVAEARPRPLLLAEGHPPPFRLLYGAAGVAAPEYDFAQLPPAATGFEDATAGMLGPETVSPPRLYS